MNLWTNVADSNRALQRTLVPYIPYLSQYGVNGKAGSDDHDGWSDGTIPDGEVGSIERIAWHLSRSFSWRRACA